MPRNETSSCESSRILGCDTSYSGDFHCTSPDSSCLVSSSTEQGDAVPGCSVIALQMPSEKRSAHVDSAVDSTGDPLPKEYTLSESSSDCDNFQKIASTNYLSEVNISSSRFSHSLKYPASHYSKDYSSSSDEDDENEPFSPQHFRNNFYQLTTSNNMPSIKKYPYNLNIKKRVKISEQSDIVGPSSRNNLTLNLKSNVLTEPSFVSKNEDQQVRIFLYDAQLSIIVFFEANFHIF